MISFTSVKKQCKIICSWALQNWQNCKSQVVNSATFQISKIYQIFVIFRVTQYI
jgi:hypothetical protein